MEERKDGRAEGWNFLHTSNLPRGNAQAKTLPILQEYELTLRKLFQIKIIPTIEP